MTAARIPIGSRRQIGIIGWSVARVSGLATNSAPPNLFLTLGHNRKLFRGWLHFAGRLMPGGSLRRRETELVILRVAHLRRCGYEFDHHVQLGKRAGIDDADIARVVEGPTANGWSAREHALLSVVDELHHSRDVSDAAWDSLCEHLGHAQTIELCMLVGHYEMLATTIAALRIQPDEPRRARG